MQYSVQFFFECVECSSLVDFGDRLNLSLGHYPFWHGSSCAIHL